MIDSIRRQASATTAAARVAFRADRFLILSALAALAVVSGCAAVVAKLLDDVMGGDDAARLDPSILQWFIDHRTELLTACARWITHLGDPVVVAAVVLGGAIALVVRGRVRLALFVVASAVGAAVATTAAKYAVDRTRPPEALWLAPAYGPSFPSGHATQSVACYMAIAVVGVIVLRAPAARVAVVVAAGAVALLVGTSRIYLGVHWPSDVLCGWAVAMLWLVSLLLVSWFRPRLAALWSTRSLGSLQPEGATGSDPPDRRTSGTFTDVRKLLVVPLVALGVVVMHGLGDAGAAHAHARAEMSMSADHSAPSPGHTSSHLAVMAICAFAVLVAAHRVRRTAPPLRPTVIALNWPVLRLGVGPEPPVPRSLV